MKDFKGTYIKQLEYKSYSPPFINRAFEWHSPKIAIVHEKATRLLGELNAYSTLIPDIDFFISMHVTKEATESSQIEQIQTEVEDVILKKEQVEPEHRDDWQEVQKYITAMHGAIEGLHELPLSMRLLQEIHKDLLSGVRGEHKQPGQTRTSQNWIGGSSLSDAFFIPPHPNELPELLTDFEKFLHNKDIQIPLLIKCAVAHYQFETIHPFLDGNGRIGRLLIVLQLIDAGYLRHPTLYISDFFRRNRTAYFDSLSAVRNTGDMDQWILFFLNGVVETAQKGIYTFEKIVELQSIYQQKIHTMGARSEDAALLIREMYTSPRIDVHTAAEIIDKSYQSANTLIAQLESDGIDILKETTGQSRNRLYSLHEYLSLFK